MANRVDAVPVSSEKEAIQVSTWRNKPFNKLFRRKEIIYYAIAAMIYITLGVLLQNAVLNFVVGPLFIVLWIWFVPILVLKWKARKR